MKNPAILSYFSPIAMQSRSHSQFQPICNAATESYSAISALLLCIYRESSYSQSFQSSCHTVTRSFSVPAYSLLSHGVILSHSSPISCGHEVVLSYRSLAIMPLWKIQPFSAILALLPCSYGVVLSLFGLLLCGSGIILSCSSLAIVKPRNRSHLFQPCCIYP